MGGKNTTFFCLIAYDRFENTNKGHHIAGGVKREEIRTLRPMALLILQLQTLELNCYSYLAVN